MMNCWKFIIISGFEKGFDSEPAYNEKYLKTKVKYHEGKVNTCFHVD